MPQPSQSAVYNCFKCQNPCKPKEEKNELFGFPCDCCKRIICKTCSRISSSEVRCLIMQSRVVIFWCPECMESLKELKGQVKNIEKDMSEVRIELKREINDLSQDLEKKIREVNKEMVRINSETKSETLDQIQKINNKISTSGEPAKTYAQVLTDTNTLKNQVKELENVIQQRTYVPTADISDIARVSPGIENTIGELQDREKRAQNILIFGFLEVDNMDREERHKKEGDAIKEVLKKLNNNQEPEKFEYFRMGKYNKEKTRPIKILFEKKETALKYLKAKDKLVRDNAYIKSDQTKIQRDFLKRVLAELQTRKERGETDIRLKYIKNIPTIIKSSQSENQPKN